MRIPPMMSANKKPLPDDTARPGVVTEALQELRRGVSGARDELFQLVYSELRRMAGAYMRKERGAHTLQPTALVHEAYLRLTKGTKPDWQDRGQFLASAARAMRRILVDHARAFNAQKRGGGFTRLTLGDGVHRTETTFQELLDIHEALERLEVIDAQRSRVVELRFFGGLTVADTARVLDISKRSVNRSWQHARLWLYREIAS